MLNPKTEIALSALTCSTSAEWSALTSLWPQYERKRLDTLYGLVNELGRRHRDMPVEQLDLLRRSPPPTLRAEGALGLAGEALSHLTTFLELQDGIPVIPPTNVPSWGAIRAQVLEDQVACWLLALRMVDAGTPARPRLDWSGPLSVGDPHLRREILCQDYPLIDAHTHLGGTLGTLDLWGELVDPHRNNRWLFHAFRKNIGPLEHPLPDEGIAHLLQAREIRDLLELQIGLERRSPWPAHPAQSRPLSPMNAALRQCVLEEATRLLFEQARRERLYRPSSLPEGISGVGFNLTRTDPIPLLLSPSYRASPHLDPVTEERRFLFEAFRYLLRASPPPWFAPALLSYLVNQNRFHQVVTQQLGRPGLQHFLQWYNYFARHLPDEHRPTRYRRILRRTTQDGRVRVEGRTSPNLDRIRSWIDAYAQIKPSGHTLGRDFGLVVHFLKYPERKPYQPPHLPPNVLPLRVQTRPPPALFRKHQFPRFHKLRAEVRQQAMELDLARRSDPEIALALLGIDAARAETDTPPEVFAPAFRFLRRTETRQGGEPKGTPLPRLKATFHAGESFHHPVSGLRTVYEAAVFLDLRAGDRIGHGMALGLDAPSWSRASGPAHDLPRGERLDDLVWMYDLLRGHEAWARVAPKIEQFVPRELATLYPDLDIRRPYSVMEVLAQAWGLRWIDPHELWEYLKGIRFTKIQETDTTLTPCDRQRRCLVADQPWGPVPTCRSRGLAFCQAVRGVHAPGTRLDWRLCTLGHETLMSGRIPVDAVRLLEHYLYSQTYRERAADSVPWRESGVPWEELYPILQDIVLQELVRRGVSVECCPSSNLAIGAFCRMADHPIFRLDNSELEPGGHQRIRATVNTDDPGVFGTNLPHEYLLLGAAAAERHHDPGAVTRWIRHLKREAHLATFLRDDVEPEPAPKTADWPPNLAMHPEWSDAAWRRLVFDPERQKQQERSFARMKRRLLEPTGRE